MRRNHLFVHLCPHDEAPQWVEARRRPECGRRAGITAGMPSLEDELTIGGATA
jgi:hypothetical protein